MTRKVWAFVAASAAIALGFPVTAHADTKLGGYNASAQASVVRIEVFDPVIPIPAEPEADVGVGFTRSTTITGPASRAVASYLFPGDAIGDGLPALTNSPLDYPVKVNSRYPATASAPVKNTAQITDGNGMTTSATDSSVLAEVNVASLDAADPAGNPLAGLCQLFNQACPSVPSLPTPALPDAVAGAVTMSGVHSDTSVELGDTSISSTAHAAASDLSLLSGLITIDTVDVTTSAVSDADKSVTHGVVKITGLEIGGQKIDIGNPVKVGGSATKVPELPNPLSSVGVKVQYVQSVGAITDAGGSLEAEGLVISIDTRPLTKALHTGSLTGPLAPLLNQIPTAGPQLSALLSLSPDIVIVVGDAITSSSANGEYVPPTVPVTDTTTPTGPATSPGGEPVPGGLPGTIDTGGVPSGPTPVVAGTRPLAATLPSLGGVPAWFFITGLLIAIGFGWLLQLLGIAGASGAGRCSFGLATDLPELRKG